MKLIKWVTYASQEVVKSENKVETFLRLRYDEMNRLFPHDPFGIDPGINVFLRRCYFGFNYTREPKKEN